MNNSDNILSQLRDIRVPAVPEASPISALLVITGILALAFLSLLFVTLLLNRRKSWLRQNVIELRQFKNRIESDGEAPQMEEELAALAASLKRYVTRLQLPKERNAVSALTGPAWLDFLDHTFATRYFTTGHGRLFGNALYTGEIHALSEQTYADGAPQQQKIFLMKICDRLES